MIHGHWLLLQEDITWAVAKLVLTQIITSFSTVYAYTETSKTLPMFKMSWCTRTKMYFRCSGAMRNNTSGLSMQVCFHVDKEGREIRMQKSLNTTNNCGTATDNFYFRGLQGIVRERLASKNHQAQHISIAWSSLGGWVPTPIAQLTRVDC